MVGMMMNTGRAEALQSLRVALGVGSLFGGSPASLLEAAGFPERTVMKSELSEWRARVRARSSR